LPAEAQELSSQCKVVFRTLPLWVKQVNFNHWIERSNTWSLFRCRGRD
jgi:hypothetical protein